MTRRQVLTYLIELTGVNWIVLTDNTVFTQLDYCSNILYILNENSIVYNISNGPLNDAIIVYDKDVMSNVISSIRDNKIKELLN